MVNKKVLESTQLKAKLFCGFGDASRLSILESLREGARSVSEIVEVTGLSQSNVSNHLGCLRECGLVKAEQAGRFVRYELSSKKVSKLLSIVEVILSEISQNLEECSAYSVPKARKRLVAAQ